MKWHLRIWEPCLFVYSPLGRRPASCNQMQNHEMTTDNSLCFQIKHVITCNCSMDKKLKKTGWMKQPSANTIHLHPTLSFRICRTSARLWDSIWRQRNTCAAALRFTTTRNGLTVVDSCLAKGTFGPKLKMFIAILQTQLIVFLKIQIFKKMGSKMGSVSMNFIENNPQQRSFNLGSLRGTRRMLLRSCLGAKQSRKEPKVCASNFTRKCQYPRNHQQDPLKRTIGW